VLSVGDRVTDDVLKLIRASARDRLEGVRSSTHEDLEDTTGLLVDEAGDTLDTTTTGETADSGLGDTPENRQHESIATTRLLHSLDVVTQHLPVTLGATLAETLATLSATRHCV
jgi:hypothetical protein